MILELEVMISNEDLSGGKGLGVYDIFRLGGGLSGLCPCNCTWRSNNEIPRDCCLVNVGKLGGDAIWSIKRKSIFIRDFFFLMMNYINRYFFLFSFSAYLLTHVCQKKYMKMQIYVSYLFSWKIQKKTKYKV